MKTATAGASNDAGAKSKTDAVALLKADHRKVEQLFAQFEKSEDDSQKQKLAKQICTELIIHTKLEEEIFYPACRQKDVESDLMDEAQVEHDGSKVLIGDLLKASPGDQYYDAKVKTLSEYIKHHVGEEEQPRSGIFAKAQKAGVDMAALGQKLQARKQELTAQGETVTSNPPQPRSFQLNSQETSSMARYSNDRDRDERGRFTDDNDNGRGRSGQGGYQSGGRDRDEYGRFTSDDDDNRSRGGYSQGGYQGGYESGGRGGYQGGYGHSEGRGSRGGWEGARGSGQSQDYDDRNYSRSQGYDRDRDERGRFTSDDDDNRSRSGYGQGGYQSGSRSGSQGTGRGGNQGGEGRGWYGDSEGHSQASREGWENRGSSRSSRGRDDNDDDNRGSSRGSQGRGGQGHGGWFGDPEGHSQASREGWRNR